MNFIGEYAGNVASNWISTTVEGAKEAAAAYGGNLAGDVIIAGGNMVAGAGQVVGNKVSGYFDRYGKWVNGYGDKLQGKPASSLPKSGPMAVYKGERGGGTLKRSASYGSPTTSSKALTKSAPSTAKNTTKPKSQYPVGSVKPKTATGKDKKADTSKALSKVGNSKYPSKTTPNGTYPSGPKKGNTPVKEPEKPQGLAGKGVKRGTGSDSGAPKGYKPYVTGGVVGKGKTTGGAKEYKPYSAPSKGPGGPEKKSGGDAIPMGSFGPKSDSRPSTGRGGGRGGGGGGGGGPGKAEGEDSKDSKVDRTFF